MVPAALQTCEEQAPLLRLDVAWVFQRAPGKLGERLPVNVSVLQLHAEPAIDNDRSQAQ